MENEVKCHRCSKSGISGVAPLFRYCYVLQGDKWSGLVSQEDKWSVTVTLWGSE